MPRISSVIGITGMVATTGIVALFLGTATHAATFDGAKIRATADYPTLPGTTTAGPVDAVVGAGIEFADGQFLPFFGPSFDFGGSTVTITHNSTSHAGGAFNGYTFNDLLGGLPDFTGFSIVSDTTGFFSGDPSCIFFDANNLYVNFQGLSFPTTSESVVLGVTFGDPNVIPLPATLPLLIGGIAGLGLLRRRRKA